MEATLWPFGKCEECTNKNYCAWSQSEIVNCMNNGYPNYSPMRNADRIRSMTDEELAVWIAETAACSDWCILNKQCETKGDYECCVNVWLDWLKEEVKDDNV